MSLQEKREKYQPKLPPLLSSPLKAVPQKRALPNSAPEVQALFPNTFDQPYLAFQVDSERKSTPLKVGAVFSGGQAAGGHNVLTGLLDALKKIHPDSQLFGFLGGPSGIVESETCELNEENLASYRNQGGFDCIGSGRTKIETPEQFAASEKTVRALNLDGLVIIGGDDSNTNAALLAEYFLAKGCQTRVVGVPKTIDGDLRSVDIETSFGFDTATKTFSETIGSICRDALSAGKYTFFIKLMGRSASHIALECAHNTHPNLTLIGEEIEAERRTLYSLVQEIADLICKRADRGKHYGVILIPEGIIEFIPEFKTLIGELNTLLDAFSKEKLTKESLACFDSIPEEIQKQLLMERDPHGNVKVSQIETERLFIEAVKQELKKRGKVKNFSAQPLFCGYEGRSCFPTNFDCDYCYALGFVSALLIKEKCTGYMACVKNLTKPPSEWEIAGIPLTTMIHMEKRKGKQKPVIKKALVELNSPEFQEFSNQREKWKLEDDYRYPGPIQF